MANNIILSICLLLLFYGHLQFPRIMGTHVGRWSSHVRLVFAVAGVAAARSRMYDRIVVTVGRHGPSGIHCRSA